jgi:hypothetical protein
VKTAFDLFGQHLAHEPLSKWHIFYRELLNHLEALAHPGRQTIMTNDEFDFVSGNFREIYKAVDLLDDFKSKLMEMVTARVREHLSLMVSEDVELTSKLGTWGDDWRDVIHIYPTRWGNNSKVVLAYRGNELDSNDAMYFNVFGYVAFGTEACNIDSIKQRFEIDTKSEKYSWRPRMDGEETTWKEGKTDKYLGVCGTPKDISLEGALSALADLEGWMQQYAFTPSSTDNDTST